MNTIDIRSPLPVATPRGALLVGWVADAFYALWRPLAARLVPPRPSVVDRELAALRELARRHALTQPGFAADLLAAADRREWRDR